MQGKNMLTSNLASPSSCHHAYFPRKFLMFKKSKPFLGEDKTSENSSMIILQPVIQGLLQK